MTKIYTLTDPITGEIKYIGKTTKALSKRLTNHVCNSKHTRFYTECWIKGLVDKGLRPMIELVDKVDEDWKFWEQYYISQFKAWGFNLTNLTEGGDGTSGLIPWNKGTKGIIKANSGSFKKGERRSPETEIKPGQRLSPKTEFKKGRTPWNKGLKYKTKNK